MIAYALLSVPRGVSSDRKNRQKSRSNGLDMFRPLGEQSQRVTTTIPILVEVCPLGVLLAILPRRVMSAFRRSIAGADTFRSIHAKNVSHGNALSAGLLLQSFSNVSFGNMLVSRQIHSTCVAHRGPFRGQMVQI